MRKIISLLFHSDMLKYGSMENILNKSWYRLDTAGLIFPATMDVNWSNVFRLSAALTEEVDAVVLQKAVDDLKDRFPSFYVSLHNGFFWCYLQQTKTSPIVKEDYAYPLTYMSRLEVRKSCLRVFYYKNRIAVEIFHCVSDGNGGKVYLATLIAHYCKLKYKVDCPTNENILDITIKPTEEELEDSFKKYTNTYPASRQEEDTFQLKGHKTKDSFHTLTTGILDTEILHQTAREYNCTITSFLASVMCISLIKMQNKVIYHNKQKAIKITVPVNMRKIFGSKTLRNFVLTVNIGVNPRKGDYSLQQICKEFNHQLAYETSKQNMASRIAANVLPQKNPLIKIAPLGLKNIVMNAVYRSTGEKKGCLNISNLGVINLPKELQPYVKRFEFIIGPQKSYPNNCSVSSYGGKTYINMIRNVKESELERLFFSTLVELGIPVEIECNRR